MEYDTYCPKGGKMSKEHVKHTDGKKKMGKYIRSTRHHSYRVTESIARRYREGKRITRLVFTMPIISGRKGVYF